MPGLGVNIDHVATLRQVRRIREPDPLWACAEAELGGADCITFRLHKDRRHVNEGDARLIRHAVHGKLNMESCLDEEIVQLALEIRPDQVTLVPAAAPEPGAGGGLDVLAHAARVGEVTHQLRNAGILVAAMVDPAGRQVHAARDTGCEAVQLHTGAYARALHGAEGGHERLRSGQQELATLREALDVALQAGLVVHAGGELTYANVPPVASLPGFSEFNIGHAIVARALFTGLRDAVGEMKRLIERPYAL